MQVNQTEAEAKELVLIRRVQHGEKDEFYHLVDAHQNKVYAMIKRQVGDSDIARELTHETFIRAYMKISQFRFQSNFSTWVIRIGLNLTSSYFSSPRFKQRTRSISFDHNVHGNQAAEQVIDGYDTHALERLQLAIGKLKGKFRDVIVLCALEKRSYEDVAQILQIPVGTVRSRLNTARNQLRKIYFEVHHEPSNG